MKLTPVDDNLEIEGAEHNYRGNTLLVARDNNINFKKLFRKLIKPHQEEFDNDRMDEVVSKEIMVECFAKTILVGWTKFKDVTGKSWPYTIENAMELLNDDQDAYDSIKKFSENINNYIVEMEKVTEGK